MTPDLDRRKFMGAAAAAAFGRMRDAGNDPESVEEWQPVDGYLYQTGMFEPDEVRTGIDVERFAAVGLDAEDVTSGRLEVIYDSHGVSIGVEAEGEGASAHVGVDVDAETAMQLGAALYQAGWELANRPSDDEPAGEVFSGP